MKIAYMCLRDPWTGAGKLNFKLFSEIKKIDEGINMLYMGGERFEDQKDRIIQYIDPYPFPIGKETLNWLFYLPKKIPKEYDVYHIGDQLFANFVNYCSPNVLHMFELPYFNVKGKFLSNQILKFGLKKARNADRIVAISNFTKDDLIKTLKIPEEKITVIYEATDHDVFKPRSKIECREKLGIDLEEKIVLYVGGETPRKNVSALIKSFYKLQKHVDNAILIRIGRKSKEIENIIKELNLESKVRYFSDIDEETLAMYYNAADIFAFTCYSAGFVKTVLEAMASGIPVIAANLTSMAEVMGGTGVHIDPFDENMIAEKMEELLLNEDLRKEVGERGHERSKFFTWKKTAKETYGIYEELNNTSKS